MTEGKVSEVVASFHFQCRAASKEGRPVLPNDQAEPIIVNVYRDGTSIPLCRYLSSGMSPYGICNPDLRKGIGFQIPDSEFGSCPYSRIKPKPIDL